jgi:hypothetical protein
MYKITRTVIDLSSIPEEYREHPLIPTIKHSYAEFHYSKEGPDEELANYLIKTYPSLKRKISFLIYIDI